MRPVLIWASVVALCRYTFTAMSLQSAADVTLVLVGQFLPCADLLRFTRCEWRLRELAYAAHVWKYARWELNDAKYESHTARFSIHPECSLRHIPVHLVASPHPTFERILRVLDGCLTVTYLDLSEHYRQPATDTATIFLHPRIRSQLRSVQFHAHEHAAFDPRILPALLPLQSLTEISMRPIIVTNKNQYACLTDLPSLRRLTINMHHPLESLIAQCAGLRFLRIYQARLNSLQLILPSLPLLAELHLVQSMLVSTDVDWQSLGSVRSLTLDGCPGVDRILERLQRIAANPCQLTSLCIRPHITSRHASNQEPSVEVLLPICTARPRLDVLLLLQPVRERRFSGEQELSLAASSHARLTAVASELTAQGRTRVTVRSTYQHPQLLL